MKNMQCFFRWKGAAAVLATLTFFLLVSCQQGAQLKEHDISEIYGYTFYGNITASKGESLKPSLILYNDNRAAWNMSIKWGGDAIQCYYCADKNLTNNYTIYWFLPKDREAAMTHNTEKAYLVLQLGINSLDEITVLRTDNSSMSGTRISMQKQANIKRNTNAPPLP